MSKLREDTLMSGFFLGAFIGALIALFRAPRIHPTEQIKQMREEIREKLEAVVPDDPITQSIAEGKAAARRRLVELGLPANLPQSPQMRAE